MISRIVSTSGLEDPTCLGDGWDDAGRTASERSSDPLLLTPGVAPAPVLCVCCWDLGCEFCPKVGR